MLEQGVVQLGPCLVGVFEHRDAQPNRDVGAGAADHQVNEVGAGPLDAHVELLLVQKLDDVRFGQPPCFRGCSSGASQRPGLKRRPAGLASELGPLPRMTYAFTSERSLTWNVDGQNSATSPSPASTAGRG